MKTLTDEKFKETIYKVLHDYEIPNLGTKLKNGGEVHSLLSTINNLYAYQTWSSKHIYSTIVKRSALLGMYSFVGSLNDEHSLKNICTF